MVKDFVKRSETCFISHQCDRIRDNIEIAGVHKKSHMGGMWAFSYLTWEFFKDLTIASREKGTWNVFFGLLIMNQRRKTHMSGMEAYDVLSFFFNNTHGACKMTYSSCVWPLEIHHHKVHFDTHSVSFLLARVRKSRTHTRLTTWCSHGETCERFRTAHVRLGVARVCITIQNLAKISL